MVSGDLSLVSKVWATRHNKRCSPFVRIWLVLSVIVFSCGLGFAQTEEEITFNVKQADISAVAEMVAGITGKNFVIDPRVQGKVTVVSSHAMDPQEVYQVFLAILQVHGFATVPSGKVIKIIPEAQAKHTGVPHATDAAPGIGDQLVTRVLQVENVAAAQLVPILRPLVPQQGHMAAYAPTNVLIISDRARNIERLVTMIRRIDKVSDNEIEVVHLKHAVASEIVRVLNSLKQGSNSVGAADSTSSAPFVADERTNTVILSGDQAKRLKLRALISHLDTPVESVGYTNVVYLHYAKADKLLDVLKGVVDTLTKSKNAGQIAVENSSIGIEADESTNALVITAPPNILASLRNVIRLLDIRKAQVMVEAVIAEVSTETADQLGMQLAADGFSTGEGAVGMINLIGGRSPTLAGLSGGLLNLDTSSDFSTFGVGKTSGDTIKFGAFIRALATDTNTNILSTPTLITLDNEEAEIIVGENRPFLTGSYTSIGGTGSTPTNPFQTIERKDVGLTLRVKPQINEGDTVRLDVTQEVSSVAPSASNTTEVVTNKRALKTSVLVEDGQIIVLGGLIDDQFKESTHKVPGLGDLPGIGGLFRYNELTKTKRNLMIFLHPRILRDSHMEASVTGGKYNYMRSIQRQERMKRKETANEAYPTLSPMHEVLAGNSNFASNTNVEDQKKLNKAIQKNKKKADWEIYFMHSEGSD